MAVLFRIMMMFVAYILACVAAALVMTIGTLTPEWNDIAALGAQSPALQSVALWSVVALAAMVIFAVGMLPTLLVIALAEGFAVRSIVLYGAIGGALALAMGYGLDFAGYIAAPGSDLAREREVFAAAGIAGGLVYWLFAGRNAGVWK
jgi:hypothetical protein